MAGASSNLSTLSRLLSLAIAGCVLRVALLTLHTLTAQAAPATPAIAAPAPPMPAVPAMANAMQAILPAAGPAAAPAGATDRQLLDPKALLAAAAELKQRREQLDQRQQEIDARASGLKEVEDRIAGQIAQLEALKQTLEGLAGKLTAEDSQRIDRLVKVYEAMKPAKAAAIFNNTDVRQLLPIVKAMREIKVAAILEEMNPAKAQAVTQELGRAKVLPTIDAPGAADLPAAAGAVPPREPAPGAG